MASVRQLSRKLHRWDRWYRHRYGYVPLQASEMHRAQYKLWRRNMIAKYWAYYSIPKRRPN